ncbi:MAG: hypothetical protein VYB22_09100 [Pseudomonadota bacterium]|nr:hypothetical protein [Pseudomonadota bacterium]
MTDAIPNQQLLIGIDDTDNLESRGTGYHARSLGAGIAENGWGSCRVITRHQLLKSPLVPFTSHNSAACVRVQTDSSQIQAINDYCLEYLQQNSAQGADAGLCIAWEQAIPLEIHQFGFVCKQQLVKQLQAWELAEKYHINLYGLTGDKDGVIGALAAVGLQASGSDGRMLWLQGMREQAEQTVKLGVLLDQTGIDLVRSIEGQVLTNPDLDIAMGPWPRAIWLGGQATLIVEPDLENPHGWQVAAKDYLRQF